jgi:multicomponent Na+:H+ antiporter subunit D
VTWLAVAVVALPVVGSASIALLRPGRRVESAVSIAVAAAAVLGCAGLALAVPAGSPPPIALIEIVPPVALTLRIDALGCLFALTVSLLYLLTAIHAASWLSGDAHRRLFQVVFLACLGPMLLVAFAANLVTLLVGYELFSLASVLLIVHLRTPAAFAAGLKYLVYVMPGSTLTLVGILMVFAATGSMVFTPGGLVGWDASDATMRVAWAALVFGFGVKAALFPLHGWVPDAHPAAPAPFSAVLSGVMVATGAFAIVRVLFEIFGPVRLQALGVMPWLAAAAAAGVVVAGVLAAGEDELKRRLAYSTISQMGYATLAASLLDPRALTGALVHLANHAFIKGGLFFVVGAIAVHAGVHRVSELPGLSRRMPAAAVLLTLLSLALIGLPPLAGFTGKWLLVGGAAAAGAWAAFAVLLAGSALAALYLWPVMRATWSAGDDRTTGNEPRDGMLLAALLAGVLTVALGVAAASTGYPLALAERAAGMLAGEALR